MFLFDHWNCLLAECFMAIVKNYVEILDSCFVCENCVTADKSSDKLNMVCEKNMAYFGKPYWKNCPDKLTMAGTDGEELNQD